MSLSWTTGYDHPPWPGAPPYAILSSDTGYVTADGLDGIVGYHHGGASADIDADGDLDVFVTENFNGPFFLVNDGSGHFTWDTTRVDLDVTGGIFTAELVDVDRDGYVDVLAAGQEFEGFATQILWGDASGLYSQSRSSVLPTVPGYGWVVDIDVADTNGDSSKDVVVNRTGDDGGPGWYEGYYVQLLHQTAPRSFGDVTRDLVREYEDDDADWVSWLTMADIDADGDVDIFADEASRGLIWKNDGSGRFEPGPLMPIPPNHTVDEGTSHSLQSPQRRIDHATIRSDRPGWALAYAYGDFDADGDQDVFYAPTEEGPSSLPAEVYLNDGDGNFRLDRRFMSGNTPTLIRATKALPGDYNDDGQIDIFVIGAGNQSEEVPYVILSDGGSYVLGQSLGRFAGTNYGAASADVDADGDLDVFVSGLRSFLWNDGDGVFRAGPRVEGLNQFVRASELVDVDRDGYVDLVVGAMNQRPTGARSFGAVGAEGIALE